MFNVIREKPGPKCLNSKEYNTKDVVDILNPMFHGKCYLCEQDELTSPEIEHFDPHKGDESKKYDWHNLYYACGRCNSIKGTKHVNLLDCCDEDIDVFKNIKCVLPSDYASNIVVEALNNDDQTINTVTLIERCYNEENTALRGITRSVLMNKLFKLHVDFLGYKLILKEKGSGVSEKSKAKEKLVAMVQDEFPFSVFWKWHVLSNPFLLEQLSDEIDF